MTLQKLKFRIIQLVFAVLAANTSFSQVITDLPESLNGVEFQAFEVFCPSNDEFDQQKLLINLSNPTNEILEISWKSEIWINGICVNCSSLEEYYFNVVLLPNSSVNGVCYDNVYRGLSYFVKFDDAETTISDSTTSIFFRDLIVNEINN
jgi:hypothetical protein